MDNNPTIQYREMYRCVVAQVREYMGSDFILDSGFTQAVLTQDR
jgi:hypothetical protein